MLKLLKKKETKPNPSPVWSHKDLMGLVKFWSEKSRKQDKEIESLIKYYEKNQRSRFSRCFALFKIIAMNRKYGEDHLGFAVAKNKCMGAASLKYLKNLSNKELIYFQSFLTYLQYNDHLPINTLTFKTWENNLQPEKTPEEEILNFVLQFKSEDYSQDRINLLGVQIAALRDKLLKKNVTS